jgi:transcriptional regulator with PAS, ATPase and Fis domain
MPYQEHDVRVLAIRDISWRKAMEEENAHLQKAIMTLKSTVKDRYKFGDIIGKSPAMQHVYDLILKAADSDANVVVYGESGTGKDLVARTIHKMSDRRGKTFVPVNCAGIPDTLLESEFFGHRKGAFTGALRDKQGFFDAAHNGTLFLDEVGELSLTMQAKLLRAIEGKGYTPVGDHTVKHADVRIVAATNKNLEEQVKKGLVREDFFYRIQVIVINVPPLRHRKEDIPLLVAHFLEQLRKGEEPLSLPGEVFEKLYKQDWPGNIRELQNVLQRYLTLNRLDFLGSDTGRPVEKPKLPSVKEFTRDAQDLHDALNQFEKHCLLNALEQNRWHKGKAAKMLGIDRKTLYRKIKKFDLL